MIRNRIATILIAVTLLLGFGHALTPGYHSAGEIEWCHDCTAP